MSTQQCAGLFDFSVLDGFKNLCTICRYRVQKVTEVYGQEETTYQLEEM